MSISFRYLLTIPSFSGINNLKFRRFGYVNTTNIYKCW